MACTWHAQQPEAKAIHWDLLQDSDPSALNTDQD